MDKYQLMAEIADTSADVKKALSTVTQDEVLDQAVMAATSVIVESKIRTEYMSGLIQEQTYKESMLLLYSFTSVQ